MNAILLKNEATPTIAKEKNPSNKPNVFNNSPTGCTATLYNFGYAPKHIIEKFQEFCYDHVTLADAINALLERDSLLIKKYRFRDSSKSFQMLARPTKQDKAHLVRGAVLSLHKYTKEGRFKSVADAIEELLLSPLLDDVEDFSNNVIASDGCEYTELTLIEQNVLNKIADALIVRINTIENSAATNRTFTSVKTQRQRSVFTPYPKKKPQASTKNVISNDPDYDPVPGKNKSILARKDWTQNKELTLINNSSCLDDEKEEPADIEMLIPIRRLVHHFSKPKKSRVLLRQKALAKTAGSRKYLFMLNQLELIVNNITPDSVSSALKPTLADLNLLPDLGEIEPLNE